MSVYARYVQYCYPSLTRPMHSAGVYVLDMYNTRYPSLTRPMHSAGVYVLGM